jgi:hypothetical protein
MTDQERSHLPPIEEPAVSEQLARNWTATGDAGSLVRGDKIIADA